MESYLQVKSATNNQVHTSNKLLPTVFYREDQQEPTNPGEDGHPRRKDGSPPALQSVAQLVALKPLGFNSFLSEIAAWWEKESLSWLDHKLSPPLLRLS